MKKYLTSLNGKRYAVEEVLLWSQSRQKIHFDKAFRQRIIENTKKQMTPEVRERLRQKALKQTHTPEYIANLKARWADPEFKARTIAKVQATKAAKFADPEYRMRVKAKRNATIAAKIKANPNYYKERHEKELATKAKSVKWQAFLARIRKQDDRRKYNKPKAD